VFYNGCTFSNSQVHPENALTKGGFMQINAVSNVTVNDCSFESGYAMQGGALYILGESSVYILNSRFSENIADNRGGAICAESFTNVSITSGC
jgi:predicted outer membrane repeat protein